MFNNSQRIPDIDRLRGDVQRSNARDVQRLFPDVQARRAANDAGQRPLTTAPPPRILKNLAPSMWGSVDYEAHQIADQTRKIWGIETYDGTKFEYTGVGKPCRLQPMKRYEPFRGFAPPRDGGADSSDDDEVSGGGSDDD